MNLGGDGFSIINAFLQFAELGAEWVMWLLLALGLLVIVLFFERFRLFQRTKVNAPGLGRGLVEALDADDMTSARQVFARGLAMEERVIADALSAYERGPSVVQQVINSSLARERQRFDRFLLFFGTVGNNAPFIGLLGTVIGIIVSFKELGANPKGGLEVVGPGIAEALVATAVGLLVAIPSVILFNTFKAQVKQRVTNTEFLSGIIMARLENKVE